MGAIHSTKISGNFGPELNGSVRSNRKSFEKTGPPFEVVLFSRSNRSEILVEWIAPYVNRVLCSTALKIIGRQTITGLFTESFVLDCISDHGDPSTRQVVWGGPKTTASASWNSMLKPCHLQTKNHTLLPCWRMVFASQTNLIQLKIKHSVWKCVNNSSTQL